jgi:hypothetical protein
MHYLTINMDPQRLDQSVVDRDVMVTKFLPQRLIGPGLVEMGRWCAGKAQPLLRMRDGDVRRGRRSVGRRSLGVVRWALRHHTTILPHHQYLGRTLGG